MIARATDSRNRHAPSRASTGERRSHAIATALIFACTIGICLPASTAIAQSTVQAEGVPTPLTVRVIAKGGKFLGDDVGGALVTIRDVETGVVLASGVTRGGSGPDTIMTAARDRSEPIPIEDGANSAARFDAVLQLTHPRLVEITASGPIGISGRGHASAQAFVFPGFSYGPSGPQRVDGFLLEIPGLAVSIDKPVFHFLPEKVDPQSPYEIRANVTMMCGCPIGTELWPATDFSVVAYIDHESQRSVVPLTFDGTNPQHAPSQFIATDWRPGAIGSFDITVVAYQKSTGNLGLGRSSLILADH